MDKSGSIAYGYGLTGIAWSDRIHEKGFQGVSDDG